MSAQISPSKTNSILKKISRESPNWEGKTSMQLGYPNHGWILLSITCTAYLQHLTIHISDVFDPFPEMAQWVEDIAANHLPSEFMIDEEGECKTLRAMPLDANWFTLEILDPDWDETDANEQLIFLYAKVERRQFIAEFIHAWDDFLERKYAPDQWPFGSDMQNLRGKIDLRDLDFSKAREFLASKSA